MEKFIFCCSKCGKPIENEDLCFKSREIGISESRYVCKKCLKKPYKNLKYDK